MLQDRDENRRGEALAWHIRLREGSDADWEQFTGWLEQSPGNSALYDAVALADEDLGESLALLPPPLAGVNDNAGVGRAPPVRRRTLLGFAAAAAVVAGLATWPMLSTDNSRYAIETPAGTTRSIQLADGSRIDLNGGTRIILSRDHPRLASLERGEAAFSVVHNGSDPFTVDSGDARIQDIGTIFNVVRDGEGLELAVAEGSVVYNPDREAVRLAAGNVLRTSPGEDTIRVGSVNPSAVAGWRQGRLVYDRTSLGAVARDIARTLGTPVEVSPEVAAQPFTGVIVIDRNQPLFFKRLEGLLDVRARRTATGWRISSRTRAPS
jgi:transmembrane sensor